MEGLGVARGLVGKARAVPLGRSQVVPFATVTQALHVSIRLSNFEFQRARAPRCFTRTTPTCVYMYMCVRVYTLPLISIGTL